MKNKCLRYFIFCFILIIFLIFSSTERLQAQSYSIKERWNIEAGYCLYPNLGYLIATDKEYSHVFQIEVNYGITKFVEIGVYSGYTQIKTVTLGGNIDDGLFSSSHYGIPVLFYGANTNFNLLPFVVKQDNFRIDLYLSCKLGGFYRCSTDGMMPKRGNSFDYGLYAGAAFYLSKHWGLFCEYGIGNNTDLRTGLCLKF